MMSNVTKSKNNLLQNISETLSPSIEDNSTSNISLGNRTKKRTFNLSAAVSSEKYDLAS